MICQYCLSTGAHAETCPNSLYSHKRYSSDISTNAPSNAIRSPDLYAVMSCGHQWRYWFGDASDVIRPHTIGYCTLCEIVRLMNPPLIILSGSTGNKEIKP